MTTKKRGQNPGLNPWPRPRRLLPWTLGRLPPDLASAPAPIDEEDNENNRENPQADRAESNRSNEDNAAQAGGTSALPSLKDHLPSSLSDNEPAYKSYHKNVMNRGESPPAGIRMPRVWRCGKHIERPSRTPSAHTVTTCKIALSALLGACKIERLHGERLVLSCCLLRCH